MRHSFAIKCGDNELRPLTECHLEALRKWRNDHQLNKYIRPIGYITREMQTQWYEHYCERDDEIMLCVFRAGELKGAVSLYDICARDAEFGRLMIGGDGRGHGLGSFATWGCAKIAFSSLGLNELRACVTAANVAALRIYVRLGFLIEEMRFTEDIGFDEYVIRLPKNRFELLSGEMGFECL